MKKIHLLLFMSLLSVCLHAQLTLPKIEYTPILPNQKQSTNSSSTSSRNNNYPRLQLPNIEYQRLDVVVESGWYNAKVKYHNPKTKTKSTYRLNVKVFNDRITEINFGDGGSIHSGSNNSNYTYSGGELNFYQDESGSIVSADAKIRLISNGIATYFDVEL